MVSTDVTRLVTQKAMVTAGLKCRAEMWPSAESMMAMARPWARAMPRRPRPPAPCKYWSVQIEPAPKKISAKVPRNSAISFCDVLYIDNPPHQERKRARFERLHSSWNPELSASLAKRMKLDRNQRVAAAPGALPGVSQFWRASLVPFVVPHKSAWKL